MALILGDQAAKDTAVAAGLEDRIIIFITRYSGEHDKKKKKKMEGLSLAESKEQEAPEAVSTLLSNGLAESKGLSY
jgi:hypothetical protein